MSAADELSTRDRTFEGLGVRDRLGGGPVRAVLFDYGLTLVTYMRPDASLEQAYAQIEALLRERLQVPVPEAALLVKEIHDRVDAAVVEHERSGALEEIDASAAHAAAYAALGLQLSEELVETVQCIEQRAWWSGMTVPPGTETTLRALRGMGLRLGVCSNAPYHAASMQGQLEHLGLDRLLDAATFSSAVGWRKPSPRIFEAALAELGAEPSTTVVVGDRLREDVDGAHAAGLRAILCREHRAEPDPEGRADACVDRLFELVGLFSAANS